MAEHATSTFFDMSQCMSYGKVSICLYVHHIYHTKPDSIIKQYTLDCRLMSLGNSFIRCIKGEINVNIKW